MGPAKTGNASECTCISEQNDRGKRMYSVFQYAGGSELNAVLENIMNRRSIRSYTDKPVSKADLELIVRAAVYAPSGRNTQDWLFTVITDKDKLERLNAPVRDALGRDASYRCYYNAPVLILASHQDSDLAAADCACALENMFLAATSLGLGSCWINQIGPLSDDPAVRKVLSELGIPDSQRVYGAAAIGYAAAPAKAPERKAGTVCWM